MPSPILRPDPSRRDWMIGAAAAAVLAPLLARPALAATPDATESWEAALAKALDGATPGEGKLMLEMPEIAENGNTVPFTISVDSPMTPASYVKALHVFSTGNPQPVISTFHFTPASGRAAVAGRLRLAKTQQIVALAALSDGRFILVRREIKVTIGGCGG